MDADGPVGMPMLQTSIEPSEVWPMISCESRNAATSVVEYQLKELGEVMKYMNLILANIKDNWLLVKSRCTSEALRALRACKEGLAMFTPASLESAGALALIAQYLQVVKLFTKIWERIAWKIRSYETGGLDILLGKLDVRLTELRPATLKKLCAIISHIEILNDKGSIKPSDIVMDAKKMVNAIGTSKSSFSCGPFFAKLVDLFTPEQFILCTRVRHINAELDVPGNDLENPLPFVPGLPMAIPLDISLYNVACENRLRLKLTSSEESSQFVFLDFNL